MAKKKAAKKSLAEEMGPVVIEARGRDRVTRVSPKMAAHMKKRGKDLVERRIEVDEA